MLTFTNLHRSSLTVREFVELCSEDTSINRVIELCAKLPQSDDFVRALTALATSSYIDSCTPLINGTHRFGEELDVITNVFGFNVTDSKLTDPNWIYTTLLKPNASFIIPAYQHFEGQFETNYRSKLNGFSDDSKSYIMREYRLSLAFPSTHSYVKQSLMNNDRHTLYEASSLFDIYSANVSMVESIYLFYIQKPYRDMCSTIGVSQSFDKFDRMMCTRVLLLCQHISTQYLNSTSWEEHLYSYMRLFYSSFEYAYEMLLHESS